MLINALFFYLFSISRDVSECIIIISIFLYYYIAKHTYIIIHRADKAKDLRVPYNDIYDEATVSGNCAVANIVILLYSSGIIKYV